MARDGSIVPVSAIDIVTAQAIDVNGDFAGLAFGYLGAVGSAATEGSQRMQTKSAADGADDTFW
jgi:hypothetical protein